MTKLKGTGDPKPKYIRNGKEMWLTVKQKRGHPPPPQRQKFRQGREGKSLKESGTLKGSHAPLLLRTAGRGGQWVAPLVWVWHKESGRWWARWEISQTWHIIRTQSVSEARSRSESRHYRQSCFWTYQVTLKVKSGENALKHKFLCPMKNSC